MAKLSLLVVGAFALSAQAFVVAPTTQLSTAPVARVSDVQCMAAKKLAKKAPKKVAKKVVKKVAKKAPVKKSSGFNPGKQMPASQAVNELFGGITNAFDLLRNLPK